MPTAEETAAAEAAAKATSDAAAADKAAADKAAADKAAAAGGKTPEQIAAEAAEAGKAGTDAAKAAADAKAAEEAKKGELKAPDKYELALPKDGLIDATDQAQIEELAREHNLPNDIAQSMLETTTAMLVKQSEGWRKELEADKTYGGAKLQETQLLVNQALDKVAPKGTPNGDGLRKLLNRGVGNNIHVVAALATIGRLMKEDGPIEGVAGGGESKKKSIAEQLYPNAPEFKKS
jgi:hypothetical protein